MTDPTPTRAEVERFGCDQLGMDKMPDGEWVRFTDYAALRERTEAAERLLAESRQHVIFWEAREVEARRAEAAAWNDAIEAAAGNCDATEASFIYMANANLPVISPIVARDRARQCAQLAESIRALRRAAPTEGEA